jgi:transcriptional regulator with GAF, ATPase, and Fis domain
VKLVTESAHESTIVKSELDYLRDRFWQLDSLEIVQTRSPLMEKVFDKIYSVAPTKSNVLLLGETGTGKSILARLIHRQSNRKDGPFISVHCGAIPDTLIESELFGHEKGAFTGAIRRKLGKFEIAHGGTILLDEIGTVTLSAQIKLLQVLQDGTLQRVGGEATVQTDVRVIAASNTDLKEMCDEGRFRRDLYYRLNVFPIEIPPLRERKDDIAPLVDVFLKKFNKSSPKEIHGVQEEVIHAFLHYPWFGNVRELENLMERAYILERTSMLTAESFPSEISRYQSALGKLEVESSGTLSEVRRKGIEEIERRYLKDVLARNHGKINDSANTAGITPRQLHKLLLKYSIRKEDFKSAQFGTEGSH